MTLTPTEKRANPKAQVWEDYKKALPYAIKLRDIYIETQAAEQAGILVPKRTLRMYRKQQHGLMDIFHPKRHMGPFPQELVGMIRQWNATYEPAPIRDGGIHPRWLYDKQ